MVLSVVHMQHANQSLFGARVLCPIKLDNSRTSWGGTCAQDRSMAWKPKSFIGVVSVWGHIPDLGIPEEEENMNLAWPGVLTHPLYTMLIKLTCSLHMSPF